jgi:UDP-N-acetylmuramyl pentapeptide synthase
MQPVRLPNGATVIRDEMNSSPDTWRAALQVLRESSARRRVLVASDVSDSRAKPRLRYRQLGDLACEVADAALFIGEHAHFAVKRALARGMDPAQSCRRRIACDVCAQLRPSFDLGAALCAAESR